MKKYLKKVSIIFLILLAIVGIQNGTVAKAAIIGEKLWQPEDGWNRYGVFDSRIQFYGKGWGLIAISPVMGGCKMYNVDSSSYPTSKIQFKFQGTKLRIISLCDKTCGKAINISIDGVGEEYSAFKNNEGVYYQTLVYEKINLNNSIHTVEISNSSGNLYFDSIDIDSTGKLIDTQRNILLNKSTDNLKVGQTDTITAIAPSSPIEGEVSWISSDPTVATVDSTGKVTAIKAGTANITATSPDESILSATCAVTVIDKSNNPSNPIGNRAVLTITMSNNAIRTYDLSKDELNAFLNWFVSKSEGIGQAYYIIENKPEDGKVTNRDYIMYDKIEYFNIQEYKAN